MPQGEGEDGSDSDRVGLDWGSREGANTAVIPTV